ncbi:MAG TPA: serine/threonine-protein kinase [Ktedonobacteraceae bacterium]|nr:serine/threonine-protein kinase [Ktedonobacteraceae bacterium]
MVTFARPSHTTGAPQLFDGRYRLLAEVGKGNFSRVFRAEDVYTDRLVAVKLLRQSGLAANMRGTARQNFRREAAILVHLCHERIPRLYEASLGGSQWYLVLDYIDGETLENYLKRRADPLPLHEVLAIGIQICDVLGYLHGHRPPLKFRDLKPANIMRKHNGELMLIDFGLACPFQLGRIDAVTLGTPGYAAPEQYANQWGQGASTLQSDIYSLGVILHQILSGEPPGNKTLQELFTFSDLSGKTVPSLAELVTSMLKPEPEQRVKHIQEVQARLQTISAQTLFDPSKEYAIR